MVARGSWIRYPDTFKVSGNTTSNSVPPVSTPAIILQGICDLQTGVSGSMENENEAMIYDYVLFHNEEITTEVKAGDTIECIKQGSTYIGEVKKSFAGLINKRIWFNEISK